jgi:NodT family efflux transporter outer membrane factor (OMF) lipoprotein
MPWFEPEGQTIRSRFPRGLPSLAAAFLASCAVGPDYEPPRETTAERWNALPADFTTQGKIERWWEGFGDEKLTALIARAVAGNLDLREAAARVDETRALYRATTAEFYPEVDAQGDLSRLRQSENGVFPGGGDAVTLYDVGIAASWEVDLFGRIRRAAEAAGARVEFSEEDRRDVLVTLCAEVARSYVNVRTLQRRLTAARANLASQGRVAELTRIRREGGIASSLDVAQAESVLANTKTTLPPLETFLDQEMNRLSVLLGEQPGSLRAELSPEAPVPAPPAVVGVVFPADVVRWRPDIRRAERDLASQTALVGVAEADLYPRLTLLGSFGFSATEAGELFTSASRTYSFGPAVRWDVFSGGQLRALVKSQEARVGQALARYEQAVLLAFEEVEDALIAFDRLRVEREAVAEAVRAAGLALDLSTALYKDGVADFQNVLDAQRTVLQFDDGLARVEGALVQSLIQLYRALGGGWEVFEPRPEEPPGAEEDDASSPRS